VVILSNASCIRVKFPGPLPPTYAIGVVVSSPVVGERKKEKIQKKRRIRITSSLVFFICISAGYEVWELKVCGTHKV